MRDARQGDHIRRFLAKQLPGEPIQIPLGTSSLILDRACLIVGGRNGAGKSRLLRTIAEHLDTEIVHVELHQLCERALDILKRRDDLDSMTEEFEPVDLSGESLENVSRVVGRDYEKVEWFALEIEPADDAVADMFRWGADEGEQSIVPHFRVEYQGASYSSAEMGLGEFSVHMLFWILEQYREEDQGLTLLLDEPDAYLPPVGVISLLGRLSKICRDRKWSLVMTSHSEEVIRTALDHEAFTFLQHDGAGGSVAVRSADDPTIADSLLPMPAVERILFCEDEVASYLVHQLLRTADIRTAVRTAVLWGGGESALSALRSNIPAHRHSKVDFLFVYDGDQRSKAPTEPRWPAHFLPTDMSPDDLFFSLRGEVAELATAFGTEELQLRRTLEALEGHDPHDWVNGLTEVYGRQVVLLALARMWVIANGDQAAEFAATLTGSEEVPTS